MFALCEGMKWAHLPNAGGLYDQDPELLDGFRIIFYERSKHEEAEAKKRKNEMGKGKRGVKGASRSRR